MPKKILMSPPDYFDIEYEINAWMDVGNQIDPIKAKEEWQNIRQIYLEKLGWEVVTQPPVEHLPDLVFTANGGLVIDKKVALPTFRHPVRQPETDLDKKWFTENGYSNQFRPLNDFEGEGDALPWNDLIFAGYPWRSDKQSHHEIADFFSKKVVSLQLIDARFYHLDTALTIVDNQTVAIWKGAFSEAAIKTIREIVPRVIEASAADAMNYGLNAMSDGHSIVLSDRATGLIGTYSELGLSVYPTSIVEFQKSGGGVKCLSLELRD